MKRGDDESGVGVSVVGIPNDKIAASRRGNASLRFDPVVPPDVVKTFWLSVDMTSVDSCWLWKGTTNARGYGKFYLRTMVNGHGNLFAHRVSWFLANGPIPAATSIDHLCRVHGCVRPDHLEAVSQRVNTLRGDTVPARNAAKTHCPRGHEYDALRRRTNGSYWRSCRRCEAARARRASAAARVARGTQETPNGE